MYLASSQTLVSVEVFPNDYLHTFSGYDMSNGGKPIFNSSCPANPMNMYWAGVDYNRLTGVIYAMAFDQHASMDTKFFKVFANGRAVCPPELFIDTGVKFGSAQVSSYSALASRGEFWLFVELGSQISDGNDLGFDLDLHDNYGVLEEPSSGVG